MGRPDRMIMDDGGQIVPDQAFQRLGTEAHTNQKGWLEIVLSSQGVTEGEYLAADAVLIATHDSCPRPGSWANREENGLTSGMVIDVGDTRKRVDLEVYKADDLVGHQLRLDWNEDYIRVYDSADGDNKYDPGVTWAVTEFPESVWVEGYDTGGTEMSLAVLDNLGNPVTGRPIPDRLCISLNE